MSNRKSKRTLSIIIPVWNEERTLVKISEKIFSIKLPKPWDKEIIFVNDGSKDKSEEIINKLIKENSDIRIQLLNNPKNMGKSQTVKNGILKSTGDVVVIQDADMEYEPTELAEMLELMIAEKFDYVYGNRFGKKNKVIYWKNYWGNKLLTSISNIFTYPRLKVWIPDMEVCYKMAKGDIFRNIAKTITATSTFGLEPEVTAKFSKYKVDSHHLKLGVHPISYYPRSMEEGKKMHAVKDGLKALREIFYYNLFDQSN